jgi:HSP20 family molecular chaperone IbpA
MPNVNVKVAEPNGSLAKELLADFEHLMERVRKRAYELFEQRGCKTGADRNDWYQAEEELLFPINVETKQEPGQYICRLSVPGFTGKEIKVYAIEGNLVVKGEVSTTSESEVPNQQTQSIFYQLRLPEGARVEEMTAGYKQEELTINIPIKAQPSPVEIAVVESDAKEAPVAASAAA